MSHALSRMAADTADAARVDMCMVMTARTDEDTIQWGIFVGGREDLRQHFVKYMKTAVATIRDLIEGVESGKVDLAQGLIYAKSAHSKDIKIVPESSDPMEDKDSPDDTSLRA